MHNGCDIANQMFSNGHCECLKCLKTDHFFGGPDISIKRLEYTGRRMNPKVGGSSPPRVETFSAIWLRNFDTFPRTPVRASKMNAVARAQTGA